MIYGRLRALGLGLLILSALSAPAQTNGIFADFTTSMGNFTCQLSYSNAPKAVANFIENIERAAENGLRLFLK